MVNRVLSYWLEILFCVVAVSFAVQAWQLLFAPTLDFDKICHQLEEHEGKRYAAYDDMLGVPHIGIGFNLSRTDARDAVERLGIDYDKLVTGELALTERQVRKLFLADVKQSIRSCEKVFPQFDKLSDVRQRALVDMMFNLGELRFLSFEKMIAAVQAAKFNSAADEMVDSKWYQQVGRRGPTIANMMRYNQDPEWLR